MTRFTRMLIRGLAEVEPPGRWLVWGPSDMVGPTWPGVEHASTSVDPASWFGQRSAFRVPHADIVLHPHQTRPLHRLPAASCVLDLIQLQHPVAAIRVAKALRLRASVRAAAVLFTISSSVRDELIGSFGVHPSSVSVLPLPVDSAAASRVRALRSAGTAWPSRYLLTVGRFDRHKNLPRLIEAFAGSRFAHTGGELHLVGGTEAALVALGAAALPSGVRIVGVVGQPQLEAAMAGATALVQASLVEGYGLPVAEALASGVPVVSSPVPAVAEFGPPGVPTFDPRSVSEMRDAIDATVDLVDGGRYWHQVDRESWVVSRPTTRTLAEQVLRGLAWARQNG